MPRKPFSYQMFPLGDPATPDDAHLTPEERERVNAAADQICQEILASLLARPRRHRRKADNDEMGFAV